MTLGRYGDRPRSPQLRLRHLKPRIPWNCSRQEHSSSIRNLSRSCFGSFRGRHKQPKKVPRVGVPLRTADGDSAAGWHERVSVYATSVPDGIWTRLPEFISFLCGFVSKHTDTVSAEEPNASQAPSGVSECAPVCTAMIQRIDLATVLSLTPSERAMELSDIPNR